MYMIIYCPIKHSRGIQLLLIKGKEIVKLMDIKYQQKLMITLKIVILGEYVTYINRKACRRKYLIHCYFNQQCYIHIYVASSCISNFVSGAIEEEYVACTNSFGFRTM